MSTRFPEGAWSACLAVAASLLAMPLHAGSWPAGFSEVVVWSGLSQPTAVVFAADGRAFVAEKSGLVKVFDGLGDPTPTTFADLRPQVYNYWDRGLLGMTLHPDFPATPWLYVFYTLDRKPGGPIPSWNDNCFGPPNGPAPTTDGCTAGGRLSRLETYSGAPPPGCASVGPGVCERVLLGYNPALGESSYQWCQQFPSHSVGALAFGADGALYATAGDGASFNNVDYGQYGGTIPAGCTTATCFTPKNVCGDPPGGVGGVMTPPTARGGALRSQSPERPPADPRTLNGSILRLDADGNALPDNPMAGSPDPNERRVVGYGLRNPFRMTVRPGTSEVWIGDTGWNNWEEIDWHPSPASSVANFGWPCYEGGYLGSPPAGVNLVQGAYDGANLTVCESLYGGTGTTPPNPPFFAYAHSQNVVPGDGCGAGSSSMGGLAFYTPSGYPSAYDQALFFTDYNRRCIWVMKDGADGDTLPEPEDRELFGNLNGGQPGVTGGVVDLEIGPAGDLYVVNYDAGNVLRVRFSADNGPPNAVLLADPTNGPAPLLVQFDGSGSYDPDADPIVSYEWDLDGDGQYDDALGVTASWTYALGTYEVGLRVTDAYGATGTTSVTIQSDNTPPVATIQTPPAGTTWRVGDKLAFSGDAADEQDGALPDSAFDWILSLVHCPSDCHEHQVQTWRGVKSGTFSAPDHEYPSYLILRLTATDSGGLSDTEALELQPQTVVVSLKSRPPGLTLVLNAEALLAPFSRTVIIGSSNSLSAPSPQDVAGVPFHFWSWSDGGAASHNVTAPASPVTWSATYRADADLGVTLAAAPPEVTVRGLLTYSSVVTNQGPGQAYGVVLQQALPAGAIFVSATPGSPPCSEAAGLVTCNLATLTAGSSREVGVVVRPTIPGIASSTVTVHGDETDPQGANDSASVSVTVNPLPEAAVGDVAVVEGTGTGATAAFSVTLSIPSSETVTAAYSTAGGTATPRRDFEPATGTLVFAPGTLSQAVPVAVKADDVHEADETFSLVLGAVTGTTVGDGSGLATLLNDDPVPAVSVHDASVAEGDSGPNGAILTVTLSGRSAFPVAVDFATMDGTAVAPGDYTAASGTLSFPPLSLARTFVVLVRGDEQREPDETVALLLANPIGAVLGQASAQLIILNDDAPLSPDGHPE